MKRNRRSTNREHYFKILYTRIHNYDQDSAFMSMLMNYLFKNLNIKIKMVVPYNHQSLQAKHGIKSLSIILNKCFIDQRQMWPKFLPLETLAHYTFILQI